MYAIVYGVIGDNDNGEPFVDGPFFHMCCADFDEAENHAKELGSSKTKNQAIPWIIETQKDEVMGITMARARDSWFKRFRLKTLETAQTIQRDQDTSTCPFADANFESLSRLITECQ